MKIIEIFCIDFLKIIKQTHSYHVTCHWVFKQIASSINYNFNEVAVKAEKKFLHRLHHQIAAFVWDKKYVEREFELLCSKGTTIFETFLIENLHLIERIKRLYHFNVNDVIVLLVKLYNLTGSRLFFINIWVFVYNIDGWDSKLLSMIVVQAQHFIILWKNTTFTKPAKF